MKSYVCYDRWFVQDLLLLKVFRHSYDHCYFLNYSLILFIIIIII
jgi:hypothetical protein